MKLSILIPTLYSRSELFIELVNNLEEQIKTCNAENEVEIISLPDNGELTIGDKRNELIGRAKGEYVCFFDDDDEPSKDYVNQILNSLVGNPDCCSLTGVITFDGENPRVFEHSIDNKEYFEKDGIYYRPPNHLNAIKKVIAINYTFKPVNHGEDTDYSTRMCADNILQSEAKIEGVIYHYKFKPNK